MTNKKLKPFNLEAAKAGAAVITRDGRSARIVCFDRASDNSGKYNPLIALITELDGHESFTAVSISGSVYHDREICCDLFMAPVSRSGYLNIYPDILSRVAFVHPTREEADRRAGSDRSCCLIIEWEE